MAESAAHVTRTSHPRPSVLEVVAQQSLGATIHPALQRLLQFLAQSRPESFGWLASYCDELYLGVSAALQYHYLKKQGEILI